MNVPHGYAFNDDPYDNRNNIEIPAMDLLFLTMGFVVTLQICSSLSRPSDLSSVFKSSG